MRLILTRHYKTRTNEDGRILGWGDSPPGDEWKSDIDYVDRQLQARGLKFDAIYSSDLARARQTAIIHAVRYRIEVVNSAPELNEVNYGRLQAQKKSSIGERYPLHKVDPDMVYPDGESFRQMQRRSVAFVSSLASSCRQNTILVVSHAGVIRGLISHYLDLEYAQNLKHRIAFRYIGDFLFEGGDCKRYDELGEPSGFVSKGIVKIPAEKSVTAS